LSLPKTNEKTNYFTAAEMINVSLHTKGIIKTLKIITVWHLHWC